MTRSLRLLLVGASAADADLITTRLKELSVPIRLDVARRTSEGLELLSEKPYDLVLAKVTPAGALGGEELNQFKLRRPDVPLAVLGTGSPAELMAAMRAHAQDYLATESLYGDGLERILTLANDNEHAEYLLRECRARNSVLLAATNETIIGIRANGTCSFCKLSRDFPISRPSALIGRNVADSLPRPFLDSWLAFANGRLAPGHESTVDLEVSHEGRACRFAVRFLRVSKAESLVLFRNVSKSKEIEDRVRLSQRLESLGSLAGGVAHDFNNVLTVIQGNAELSLMTLDGDGEQRALIEEICEAANWAANLTRQLLAFSRNQNFEPVSLDLNGVVKETEAMLRRLIGEDIELESVLDTELDVIRADPSQVRQILVNLAINARDAMPRGGKLTFQTQNVDVHETYVGQEVEIKSGPYVALAVSDTGLGMDAETRNNALDPFFTTKGARGGTGLGLSMVYGIVKQSGGYLWLHSETNAGTTVEIYFPRDSSADASEPRSDRNGEAGALQGHDETILLVEDDLAVLQVAQRFLREGGYQVVTAKDATEALAFVAGHPDRIDLLATDVVMPAMSGTELASRVAAVHPGLKVLYMSGYLDDTVERHGVGGSRVNFLEKPYHRDTLLAAVRRALDGSRDDGG